MKSRSGSGTPPLQGTVNAGCVVESLMRSPSTRPVRPPRCRSARKLSPVRSGVAPALAASFGKVIVVASIPPLRQATAVPCGLSFCQ
jgi:hypothetical protein